MKTKKVKISLTLEKALIEELKRMSAKSNISVSTIVNLVLEGSKCLKDFAS